MVKVNILIAGVGGQGVVLASDILGDVALEGGADVKKTDTLGMAQRGGSVVTYLRIGEKVASPLIGEGEVDIMLGFEKAEAARWTGFLKQSAVALVNDLAIPPLSVSLGSASYPDNEAIVHILRRRTEKVWLMDGSAKAAEIGNPKVLNIFMLGALSVFMPFDADLWIKVLSQRLPSKILSINLTAFEKGRSEMQKRLSDAQK
jgi:indolepyruvate ferredoxin oxidoreductase beta subunit